MLSLKSASRLIAPAFASMLLLLHCGNSGSMSMGIGPAGGTVSLTSGLGAGASVVIPSSALMVNTNISIMLGDPATDLPDGATASGPTIVFGPEGQHFGIPVTLTLPTTATASLVYTRPASGGTWTLVNNTHSTPSAMVAHVDHFSAFVPAAPSTATCSAPTTLCGTPPCVNLATDANNCGTCGHSCGTGHVCQAGQCTVACTAPQVNCGGTCVNVTSDPMNCSGCGLACAPGQVCQGICMTPAPCNPPMTSCGGICINLQSDPQFCGSCSNNCQSHGWGCMAGTCGGPGQCMPPQDSCGGSQCYDLTMDPANCGTCNTACTATQHCVSGTCM